MLAVTTYDWLLTVHVLAAVMWVGGAVMLTLLGLMTLALRDPIRLSQFAQQVAFLGGRYFPPLSLMVVGFGFGLVSKGSWSYSDTWIQIGIAGWAASFVIGAGYLGPHAKKLAHLLETRSPEDREAQDLIQRILLVARFDALLLLFVVLDMTAKPWS
ncbi:MAG TPA: hypothetical protein VLJ76_08620 [Gaiellaceae bacterium]|nr:hypothetical protein [Gaiellaceae bacterium]